MQAPMGAASVLFHPPEGAEMSNRLTPGGKPAAPEPQTPTLSALAAADHVQGDPDARLTLVEYGDYECPACIEAAPVTQQIVKAAGKRLCFVYRHFPMMQTHPNAELAAEAAEAAAAQGPFWAMHKQLFAQTHGLALPALTGYAAAIGLDMIRFKAEMADRIYTQRVQEHRRAGDKSGVRATPAYFLNGKRIDVSAGLVTLQTRVQAALAALPVPPQA
jgi:protein-disulfide isomerase